MVVSQGLNSNLRNETLRITRGRENVAWLKVVSFRTHYFYIWFLSPFLFYFKHSSSSHFLSSILCACSEFVFIVFFFVFFLVCFIIIGISSSSPYIISTLYENNHIWSTKIKYVYTKWNAHKWIFHENISRLFVTIFTTFTISQWWSYTKQRRLVEII